MSELPGVLPPGSYARIYSERAGGYTYLDASGWKKVFDASGTQELYQEGPPPKPYVWPSAILVPLASEFAARPQPIPMVLHCPKCGRQHLDIDDGETDWSKRPHRTHKCENTPDGPKTGCGALFRPAHVSTVGVRELPPREVA